MESFKPGQWNKFTLSGKIDKRADMLAIGALYSGKARFFYDAIQTFASQIPALSKHYKVIAVDTRGHGKSTADTTKLTYELYADDTYKLLNELKLDSVNVLGWSDGGNTGLILAMQHPEKVKKLAIMGANLYNDNTAVQEWVNDTLRQQIKRLEQTGSLRRYHAFDTVSFYSGTVAALKGLA